MIGTREFKRRAEAVLREGNAEASIAVEWLRQNTCTWADGSKGRSGTMRVSAPGYRTREMTASYHDGTVGVR